MKKILSNAQKNQPPTQDFDLKTEAYRLQWTLVAAYALARLSGGVNVR